MDIISRHIQILEWLAEGINPATGEVISETHFINHSECVRAIFCGLEALSSKNNKVPKKFSTKEKKRISDPTVPITEQMVNFIKAAVSSSSSWKELNNILLTENLCFAPEGGGIALFVETTGQKICKGSSIRCDYVRLMKKFKEPFPGHPHTWLEDKFARYLK